MHSKWRYKTCISVFGHSRGTWVFSKLRGIQNYFPENFRCNLTYYEGDDFSDSFSHHIFESENLRIPFYCEKLNVGCPWPELWKTTIGLIAAHFLVLFLAIDLHDCNANHPENFLVFTFHGRNVVHVLVHFSTAAHFFSSGIKFVSVRWS